MVLELQVGCRRLARAASIIAAVDGRKLELAMGVGGYAGGAPCGGAYEVLTTLGGAKA